MTANRALKELTAEGVLVRIAGVGTFVAEQRVHAHPLEVRNIADEIRARGHEYRVKVLALTQVAATRELAERFGLKPGAPLDYSLLTHFEGPLPLQVEERYVNPLAAPGYLANDFTRTTPHEFLIRVAPLQRAEHIVRALAARPAHPPPVETGRGRGLSADQAPHLLAGACRQSSPIFIIPVRATNSSANIQPR